MSFKMVCLPIAMLLLNAWPSMAWSADIRCAPFVQPLNGNTEVTVNATNVSSAGDELRVLQDQNDVTALVVVNATVVMAEDANEDGVYEAFARHYTLDLSGLPFDRPTLVLEATTFDAQGAPSTVSRSISMVDPFHIGTDVTSWTASVDGTVATFYLRIQGVALVSKSIAVFKNGQDVTASAEVSERVVWDSTRNGVVQDRMIEIQVDLQSIGFDQLGDTIQLRSDLSVLKDLINLIFSIFSPQVVVVDPTPETVKCQAVKACVQAFVIAANVSASGGQTTIGASPTDVGAAGANLKACLEAAGMTTGSKHVSIPGVGSVTVGVGMADGAAALVVVVGASGAAGTGGGNVTAENTEPGGAAIAVGGAGGAGSTGGGNGNATSNGGDAVGVGGAGGDGSGTGSGAGGPGGSAMADNKVQGGTAKGMGGNGGDPLGGDMGGSGGNASAKAGASTDSNIGGSGGSGTYGTGATASKVNGQSGGADGTGGH